MLRRILELKNAIITGSSSGIGLATIKVFAENGTNIWAFARSKTTEFEDALKKFSECNRVWIKPVYVDFLTDEIGLKRAFLELEFII